MIVILGSHQHHAVIQIQAKGLMAFEKRLQILIALSEQGSGINYYAITFCAAPIRASSTVFCHC